MMGKRRVVLGLGEMVKVNGEETLLHRHHLNSMRGMECTGTTLTLFSRSTDEKGQR